MNWKRLVAIGAALSISAARAHAQDFDKDLTTTLPLLVMIHAQLGGAPIFGAGIVFGREKDRLYIVTASHVVRRGDAQAAGIQVNLRSLPDKALPARLLPQFDRDLDIAVLSVDNLASQGVDVCALRLDRLGDPAALRRGSGVYPVGNPNGAAWGMPVSPDPVAMVTGDEITFQSAFLTVGVSGGALLDADSRLVAMVRRDEPPYGKALSLDKVLAVVGPWGYPMQLWRTDALGSTPLHRSVTDTAKVKGLLAEACVDVNSADVNRRTALHYAAQAGNAEVVQLLLRAGAKLDAGKERQVTALHEAAAEGRAAVAKLLLAAGADVNLGDWDHMTPLIDAVRAGSLETARLLLEHGADVDKATGRYSPLGVAVSQGTPQMVALLIAAGADVNSEALESSILHMAAQHGDPETLRQLIAAGANVNARSKQDAVALEGAVAAGHLEAMRLLLAAGADAGALASDKEDTLLHVAAKEGRVDAMRLLLDAGAPVNAEGSLNYTPLHEAIRSGSPAAVNLLIDRGANLVSKDSSATAPICLAYEVRDRIVNGKAAKAARLEIVKTLIAHSGSAIDTLAERPGCRLFERAAENGDVDIVRALLDAGANPNAKDSQPLRSAAENGQAEMVRILLAAKANVNALDNNGYTVLHGILARSMQVVDRLETVRLLLAAGAKVNTVVAFNGNTPLHDAVSYQWPAEIVKLLLAAGADPNARNARSETPLFIATASNQSEIAALLRSATPVSRKK